MTIQDTSGNNPQGPENSPTPHSQVIKFTDRIVKELKLDTLKPSDYVFDFWNDLAKAERSEAEAAIKFCKQASTADCASKFMYPMERMLFLQHFELFYSLVDTGNIEKFSAIAGTISSFIEGSRKEMISYSIAGVGMLCATHAFNRPKDQKAAEGFDLLVELEVFRAVKDLLYDFRSGKISGQDPIPEVEAALLEIAIKNKHMGPSFEKALNVLKNLNSPFYENWEGWCDSLAVDNNFNFSAGDIAGQARARREIYLAEKSYEQFIKPLTKENEWAFPVDEVISALDTIKPLQMVYRNYVREEAAFISQALPYIIKHGRLSGIHIATTDVFAELSQLEAFMANVPEIFDLQGILDDWTRDGGGTEGFFHKCSINPGDLDDRTVDYIAYLDKLMNICLEGGLKLSFYSERPAPGERALILCIDDWNRTDPMHNGIRLCKVSNDYPNEKFNISNALYLSVHNLIGQHGSGQCNAVGILSHKINSANKKWLSKINDYAPQFPNLNANNQVLVSEIQLAKNHMYIYISENGSEDQAGETIDAEPDEVTPRSPLGAS